MNHMIRSGFFSLLAIAAPLLAQGTPDWHRVFPAFKIAGNLYYVGTADLAVYLINTPQGNILINSDFEQDVPMIRASIEKLGFKYNDTKIVLISHAHGDHDQATGLIRRQTDAKLMVMDADVARRGKHRARPPRRSCRSHFARWRHGRTGRFEADGPPHARTYQRLHHVDDAG